MKDFPAKREGRTSGLEELKSAVFSPPHTLIDARYFIDDNLAEHFPDKIKEDWSRWKGLADMGKIDYSFQRFISNAIRELQSGGQAGSVLEMVYNNADGSFESINGILIDKLTKVLDKLNLKLL